MTVEDIRDLLIEIRTKLDSAITNQVDHETRLRALERTKWLAIGFAAAAGGLAGQFAAKIT
jgi:hypothetical protein